MNLFKKSLALFAIYASIMLSGCTLESKLANSSSTISEETTEVTDEQKVRASQFVEIGDEIMRQTKSKEDARELYMSAAKLDPSNIKANYMAGTSLIDVQTLTLSKRASGIEYLLKTYRLNSDYKFDLLYKLGNGYHLKGDFNNAIVCYKHYTKKLNANPNYIGTGLIDSKIVEAKIKQCKNGVVMN